MARVKYRMQPIERDVVAYFPEHLTKEATSRTLATFARQELKKAEAQNKRALGYVPPHKTWVDGRAEAALETVRPDGRIDFEFELLGAVFEYVESLLIMSSPSGSPDDPRPGHPELYARSHVLMADDEAVEVDGPIPQASEYAFVNIQPYARKIERGLSNQAPEGVYQVVADLAQRRFANMARIIFSYRAPRIGGIVSWASTTGMESPGRRGEKRDHWLRRQPAVVIIPR